MIGHYNYIIGSIICRVPLLLILLFIGEFAFSQQLKVKIIDAESKEPLIGACLQIVETQKGECTDENGEINFENPPAPPFNIEIIYLGYEPLKETITDLNKSFTYEMKVEGLLLNEVKIEASGARLKRELSLTVESIGLREIQASSESSFYESLASMREADLLTVSFGVKVVNTRGFNSSTPVRSLQLIDGIDNASPGLNYPLGNFVGLPELDVAGVDLVIGASSSYFGPGAFNGVINMRTKSPFLFPGLDIQVKGGQRNYLETGARYAFVVKNKKNEDKLGVKFNLSYAQVYDWEADNASPSLGNLKDSLYADNPGGYDAINRYGDEVNANFGTLFEQYRHPGLGKFFRTGYWEKDLAEYDSYNLKASTGIHYKINPDWELIGTTNFGTGTTVMQLDNRLSLNDIWAMQNKVELRNKDRFFFRFYTTREDAGDTYDIVSTGHNIQSQTKGDIDWLREYKDYWFRNQNDKVKALPGFPELGPPPTYLYDFDGAQKVMTTYNDSLQTWHDQTRAIIDANYLQPGTPEFEEVFNDITNTKVSEGGTKYIDRSKLYHWHAEQKFRPAFTDEITIGGSYRMYKPYSEGTIFIDTMDRRIQTYEYGAYVGLTKKFANNRFRLKAALRMDKHQNYDYLFSPSFSLDYMINTEQSLRFSLSSALRNPTLIDQYYYFKVGSAFLLGNIDGYSGLITLESFEDYLEENLDPSYLVYFDEPPIKPEEALASELSYSGLFYNNSLDIKSTVYLTRYEDFIGYKIGLQVPFYQGFPGIPTIFRFSANAQSITYTTGFSSTFTYYLNEAFTVNGNYSWNKIFMVEEDPLIPAYNTPEHKFNLGFSGYDFDLGKLKHLGCGVSFRWVEAYTYESSPQFTGEIPAQINLNAQIGKGFPKLGSIFKISATNLLNRRQNGLYGGPRVGRFIFASWQFSIPNPLK